MYGKILKRSQNCQRFMVGEDTRTAGWYKLGSDKEMAKTLADIKDGEEVTIEFKGIAGSNTLTFVAKGKVEGHETKQVDMSKVDIDNPNEQEEKKESKDDRRPGPSAHKSGFDPVLSTKQTCAHATSRVMIAMQGLINEKNMLEVYTKIYDHVLEKLNK